MNEIEFIKELDERIGWVQNTWADDLALLLADENIEQGSKKYEAEQKKISKKYAPIIAELLTIRQRAFDKAYKKQEAEYAAQFVEPIKEQSELDENGRPRGKYWKDGKWHNYKKIKTEE